MANIITKEMMEQARENDTISGLVYLRYLKKTISTKNTPYLAGEIESKNKFSVVMWSNCPQYSILENQELVNCLVDINGIISEYAGKKSIKLNNVTVVDPKVMNVNIDELKCLKYDKNLYEKCFLDEVNKNLSQKGIKLFYSIFEPNKIDGLWNKFKVEYAAKSYHDNCESGLLAHTYKCIRLLKYLMGPYNYLEKLKSFEISDNSDIKDLLYLGVILHDIGKIFEMKEGIYQSDSFNSHRMLGLEVLYKHKEEILDFYNEHWYQSLISILIGHHNGQNDSEKAKTLYAFIVHKIDEMEATFTGLGQLIETSTFENIEGAKLTWDNTILSL